MPADDTFLEKLRWSLPWLSRYPLWAAGKRLRNLSTSTALGGQKHYIFIVANHFEPAWNTQNLPMSVDEQMRRLEDWHFKARKIGEAVRDANGTKFRHTNFYPAEQYYHPILDTMAAMQAEGLGEVEIHLHHGVEKADTAENLRAVLTDFRDCLADEHNCLSRLDGNGMPMYAFVHGNLALANSCGGRFCGVDSEMQILNETGCYADMTLPSAPDQSQVPMLNSIYECGLPLDLPVPHRTGKPLQINGKEPLLPLIFTGPLAFHWKKRAAGGFLPSFDDSALSEARKGGLERFERLAGANIVVKGRPEWVFIKMYCHGFFDQDQSDCIGEGAKKFFSDIIEQGEKSGGYKTHFATAREAFNMTMAAVDGKKGSPHEYRNYRLKEIMAEKSKVNEVKRVVETV